jgi:hypothetical protein
MANIPISPPIPRTDLVKESTEEDYPDWNEEEIYQWLEESGIFFTDPENQDSKLTDSDRIGIMKRSFSVLVHRKGILFYKVSDPSSILDPLNLINGSFDLIDENIEIHITHENNEVVCALDKPFSYCKIDWLGRHINDSDLRNQVFREN